MTPALLSCDFDGSEVDGAWIENPLSEWSLLYVSACDGSFFGGDNAVVDPDFPFGGVRHHRGVCNATAALDLARRLFPGIEKVLLAGTSAGGYGLRAWLRDFVDEEPGWRDLVEDFAPVPDPWEP